MDRWTISPLSAAHLYDAAMVRRQALFGRLPWLPDLHSPQEDEGFWRNVLAPKCTILGARTSAGIVGVIAFDRDWVEQLYVLPHMQGRGIGRTLLHQAQEASTSLSLWTFQANHPARRFYERNGFTAHTFTDGSGNEEREPDVLYRWTASGANRSRCQASD